MKIIHFCDLRELSLAGEVRKLESRFLARVSHFLFSLTPLFRNSILRGDFPAPVPVSRTDFDAIQG